MKYDEKTIKTRSQVKKLLKIYHGVDIDGKSKGFKGYGIEETTKLKCDEIGQISVIKLIKNDFKL